MSGVGPINSKRALARAPFGDHRLGGSDHVRWRLVEFTYELINLGARLRVDVEPSLLTSANGSRSLRVTLLHSPAEVVGRGSPGIEITGGEIFLRPAFVPSGGAAFRHRTPLSAQRAEHGITVIERKCGLTRSDERQFIKITLSLELERIADLRFLQTEIHITKNMKWRSEMHKLVIALSAAAAFAVGGLIPRTAGAVPLGNPNGIAAAQVEIDTVDRVHCVPGWPHHYATS